MSTWDATTALICSPAEGDQKRCDILVDHSPKRTLRLDALSLILLANDHRALERVEQVPDLILDRLWQSGPFRFDGFLRNAAHTGLQVSVALVRVIFWVGGLLVSGALSFRRHDGAERCGGVDHVKLRRARRVAQNRPVGPTGRSAANGTYAPPGHNLMVYTGRRIITRIR